MNDFDEWQPGDGSDDRGLFFGSVFRDGTGSESYMTFYDQWLISGKYIDDTNDGTEYRDWDFFTWQFADWNQCGKRAGAWGIMYTELRPNGFDIIRYTLEIRYKDLTEIAYMLSDWNYGNSDDVSCYYQPHMSNKKL